MRKLATISAALAAAVFVAHYFLPPGYHVWAAAMCLMFSCSAFFFRGDTRLRIILICLGAAVGFAAGGVSYAQKAAPSVELSGETLTFSAEITEYPYVADNYASVAVSVKDDAMPRVNALLYFFGSETPDLKPGDRVSVTARVKYAGELYGAAWDRYTSENIYLLCYPEKIEITGKSPLSFLYFPRDIALAVKNTAHKVMPEGTVAFITALLTGDKGLLYDDAELYTAMSRAGVLHVVAVSGMHVAFLVGFLRLILRKRKTASLIGIPAVWIFAAVAGGTPSVIRAAFMQSAVLAAPLLKRENDGLTSLTAILAILLLINPDACASVSLQLSFSAMLGMILITPRVNKGATARLRANRRARLKNNGAKESLPLKAGYKALFAVIASFAATIGALVFSTPFMAWRFGCVATYSVIANILLFWAISACFILGYAACFLGMVWLPLGVGCGAVTGALTSYVIAAVKLVGSLPLAQIYVSEGYFLFWLIFTYAVFIAWYLIQRGKRFRPVIPTALMLSSLFIGIALTQLSAGNAAPAFTAVDVGQGQSIVITSGNNTAVIDCGGKNTTANAGDTVAGHLLSRGITVVDVLCITHFDDDHINGVQRLMTRVSVKYLVVAPPDANDTGRDEIMALAEKKGVEVYVIERNTEMRMGDLTLLAFEPVSRTDPTLIFLASVNDYDILVTGDADIETEARLLLEQALPDIEIFVAGHHGSKYSSGQALLEAIDAETAVISCGYNSYGHPTEEALARFEDAGMEVLRTDMLGSVRIELTG